MTPFDQPLLAATLLDVVKNTVFVLFILSAIFLSIVVLLQEGKGGGLGGAFGGAAADTFGVKAGTVNRFTAWLAAAFLGLALLYAGLSAGGSKVSTTPVEVPAAPSTEPAAPAEEPAGPSEPAETPGGEDEGAE